MPFGFKGAGFDFLWLLVSEHRSESIPFRCSHKNSNYSTANLSHAPPGLDPPAYRRLDCDVLGLGSDGTGASGLLHGLPILKVKGPMQATKILYSVPPVYPEEARRRQVSGEVRLHVLLAKDGGVEEIEVLSRHPLLQDAALEAVRQWRYSPTLVHSRPVEVDTTVEANFTPSK